MVSAEVGLVLSAYRSAHFCSAPALPLTGRVEMVVLGVNAPIRGRAGGSDAGGFEVRTATGSVAAGETHGS